MAQTTKDFSSIYSIKDFIMKDIATKYFDLTEVNQLNVGLIGYTTDLAGSMTEDTFNAISTYIREIFPNQAQIPETLYSHAAALQIDNLFAQAATAPVVLFVRESDIITKGEAKESQIAFVLDAKMTIDVEGKQFSPDYNILITAREHAGDHIFNVQYDMTFNNSISTIKNPYIRSRRVVFENQKYLAFLVDVHQSKTFETVETVVSSDQISTPSISFSFIDQLAGFDVFYRAPGQTEYTQLEKRMSSSTPLTIPFCYYRIKDTGRIDLSFSTRDNYFRPEFNSEILIKAHTTTGSAGNFDLYTGTNITVATESEQYAYNNGLIVYATLQSGSFNGRDTLTLENLRRQISEKQSTLGAYTTESDLQTYFANFEKSKYNRVMFQKTRDDALERLFTAFSLFKGMDGNYFHTNTLYMDLDNEEFDLEYDQSNIYILKAGHVFTYDANSKDRVRMIPKRVTDTLTPADGEFLYTNPFLMAVTKKPNITGYYLNSVDESVELDYTYVNTDSSVQFICNAISVKRNAIMGEDSYELSVSVTPSSPLTDEMFNPDTNEFLNKIKVATMFEDDGATVGYVTLNFDSYDATRESFIFKGNIQTDDYMTLTQKVQFTNIKDIDSGVVLNKLVPMMDAVVHVNIFYNGSATKLGHSFDRLADFSNFTLTNTYTTDTKRTTFIIPMTAMRSITKYIPIMAEGEAVDYLIRLSAVPLIEASTLKDVTQFNHFISLISSQYHYLLQILNRVTTNYGIDMKFYNTYGRSKNFVVGDDGEKLDKTNIRISMKVYPTIGTIEEELVTDLKLRIKQYVEEINEYRNDDVAEGFNAIYVSNLIQIIENEFPSVKHMRNVVVNSYDTSVQSIENTGRKLELLTKEERRDYVPEYLTIRLEDIQIDIIR